MAVTSDINIDGPSKAHAGIEEGRGLPPPLLSDDRTRRSSLSSSSSSSSSSDSHISYAESMDVKYGMISNGLFLSGSMLQTITAIWDVRYANASDAGHDSRRLRSMLRVTGNVDNVDGTVTDAAADDYDYDDEWDTQDYIYRYLIMAGAFFFVLNAMLDLAWVRASSRYRPGEARFGGDDPKLDFWSSLTFGLGSTLEFVLSVYWTDEVTDYRFMARTNMVAMHVYFLSGVLTLKSQGMTFSSSPSSCTSWSCRGRKSSAALAHALVESGGILFLVGCTVDVVMSYLYNPEFEGIPESTLAYGGLASALTWLTDAVLCIASECLARPPRRLLVGSFVVYEQKRAKRTELPMVDLRRNGEAEHAEGLGIEQSTVVALVTNEGDERAPDLGNVPTAGPGCCG